MRIVTTAESVDEAMSMLHERIREVSKSPEDVFREEVLADRTEKMTAFGVTVDHAIQRTRVWNIIPFEAKAIETESRPPGESRIEIVEAFDEEGAQLALREKFGGDLIIDSLSVEVAGRKGFLGRGKTPGRYAATVRAPAMATVTYKFAQVSAFVFPRNFISESCRVCSVSINARDIRKAMDGSEEEYVPCVCDRCGDWVCWWCSFYLLAPTVVPAEHLDKIRESLSVSESRVSHEGCGGTIRRFKFLLKASVPEKQAHPVCSSCSKTIPENELELDKLGRITEQLFPDKSLARYGITIGCAMKCNGCGEWICAHCAETAALAAGVGALQHANCSGMFETIKQ